MGRNKDFLKKFQSICNKYLLVIIGILVFSIGCVSIFFTAYFQGNYVNPIEKTVYKLDNPIYILPTIIMFILGIYIIQKFIRKMNFKIIFIVSILFIVSIQTIWIYKTKFIPCSDQLSVILLAGDLISNNLNSFTDNTSYFGTYPFQIGIIYFIAIILKLFNTASYIVLQYVNVFFSTVSIILMYKITVNIFKKDEIKYIAFIMTFLFSIYFMFFNVHVYGNIPGMTFSLIAILYTIKFLKIMKKRYIPLIAISISLAIILKSNYNIFLCGIIVTLILNFFQNKNIKTILTIFIILFTYFLMSYGVKASLEFKTGTKISSGMPMINYIYMGMDKPTKRSSGWYNASSIDLLKEKNYNIEETKEEAKQRIIKRIEEFALNPNEFLYYYSDKIASTWLNPTFQVIWINYPGAHMSINEEYRTFIESSSTLKSMLSGNMYKLEEKYFNIFQAIIFIFASYGIIKSSKKRKIQFLILPIIFLGGFVFHIIWETKAIYVLQYYFLLIPYSCYGLNDLFKLIDKNIKV